MDKKQMLKLVRQFLAAQSNLPKPAAEKNWSVDEEDAFVHVPLGDGGCLSITLDDLPPFLSKDPEDPDGFITSWGRAATCGEGHAGGNLPDGADDTMVHRDLAISLPLEIDIHKSIRVVNPAKLLASSIFRKCFGMLNNSEMAIANLVDAIVAVSTDIDTELEKVGLVQTHPLLIVHESAHLPSALISAELDVDAVKQASDGNLALALADQVLLRCRRMMEDMPTGCGTFDWDGGPHGVVIRVYDPTEAALIVDLEKVRRLFDSVHMVESSATFDNVIARVGGMVGERHVVIEICNGEPEDDDDEEMPESVD